MIQKLKSMKANKKGFTLAELLIVVAILAVLAAIAVPTFAAQLNKARLQVDEANLRSAVSLAQADFLTDKKNTETVYFFNKTEQTADGNIQSLEIAKNGDTLSKTGNFRGESSENSPNTIKVTISGSGSIDYTATGWVTPPASA